MHSLANPRQVYYLALMRCLELEQNLLYSNYGKLIEFDNLSKVENRG